MVKLLAGQSGGLLRAPGVLAAGQTGLVRRTLHKASVRGLLERVELVAETVERWRRLVARVRGGARVASARVAALQATLDSVLRPEMVAHQTVVRRQHGGQHGHVVVPGAGTAVGL